MKAKRIKIYIKINNFFIPIPSMRMRTIKHILRFAFRYTDKAEIDARLLNTYMDEIFLVLSDMEPFEIVHVEAEDKGKRIKVIIKTI